MKQGEHVPQDVVCARSTCEASIRCMRLGIKLGEEFLTRNAEGSDLFGVRFSPCIASHFLMRYVGFAAPESQGIFLRGG
jgi:hypothetical protein